MIWKLVGIVLVILGFILLIRGISYSVKEVKGEKLWVKLVWFLTEGILTGVTVISGTGYNSWIPAGLLVTILGVMLFLNIL